MYANPANILILRLGETPPLRFDKALTAVIPEEIGLSRSAVVRLIKVGAVQDSCGRVVYKLNARTLPGSVFYLNLPPPTDNISVCAEDIALDIVFEDEHLIVVNKAAGMVVHPAPGAKNGTLLNGLLHHCAYNLAMIGHATRAGIVHRIDKGTSGLIVVAKSNIAHQGLSRQFSNHTIERCYQAVVKGCPNQSQPRLAGIDAVVFEAGGVIRISSNIARHRINRKRMAVVKGHGKAAITRIKVIRSLPVANTVRAALVECRLQTGRTHQIRVHLSHIGHGLVGDTVYGQGRKLATNKMSKAQLALIKGLNRQALHACVLGFVHPISHNRMRFESQLPQDMRDILTVLDDIAD